MTLTAAGNPYTGSPTIQSGVTVKVEPGVKLQIFSLTVKGTLEVNGTAEELVIFTGAKEEKGGEWAGISFEPGSGASAIDHAEVKWAGGNGGAIYINESSPTITNSTIHHSYEDGIYVAAGGKPEIADNILFANPRYGIYYQATGTRTGEVNFHGNVVEGGKHGIQVYVTSSGTVTGKTLGGNTILNTKEIALAYRGLDIPGNITGNTLIANTSNVIRIRGTVAQTQTWNNGGGPVQVESGITVASAATLTISKGVLLRDPTMTVNGTLKVNGTSAEPVVFTGSNETSPGEWGGITLEAGSGASVIDYAELAWGGGNGSTIYVNGSSPTITNSAIRKSYGYAISVVASGAPKIEWNRFRGNANGLSYTGTGSLAAPSNDWGCASGPKPAGCGDSVTSKVKWSPAIQLPELNAGCRGGESQCGEGADPVILATGDLSYAHRDLFLTNKSDLPLEFSRSYSSGSAADTGLGPGWSQTGLASATELASGEVLIVRQDGRQDLFLKTESGYKAPSGVTARCPRSKAPSSSPR